MIVLLYLKLFCFYLGLAYQQFVKDLRLSCKDELSYFRIKSDRSHCPRRADFNRLWTSYCREKYGDRNGAPMFEQVNKVVMSYEEQNPDTASFFQPYEEGDNGVIAPFILVIVTEFMLRVHQLVSVCCYGVRLVTWLVF
jgi:hypothetical protein